MTTSVCELRTAAAPAPWRVALVESCVIFGLFCAFAAGPTPGVNEAHYLAKAKHYWNPDWCPRDHFLNSADAHLVFYWTFGWLTLWLPLPFVAWIGRLVTWGLMAWTWQRLSWTVAARRGLSIISAGLLLLFVEQCHMAGEWIVGGVEAKGWAFVLVFLSLEAMLKGRWSLALCLVGAATSFHVLVGGWSLIAGAAAWYACGTERPPIRTLGPALLAAGLLALPGVWPALALSWNSPPLTVGEGTLIYVFERLPHHLVFHRIAHSHEWPLFPVLRHLGLLAVWLVLGWLTPCQLRPGFLGQRPLRGFVGGAVAIALCGALIDQLLLNQEQLSASLLRYYWFRLSDAMLPVGTALAVVAACERWRGIRPRLSNGLFVVATCVTLLHLTMNLHSLRDDYRRGAEMQVMPGVEPHLPQAVDDHRDWIAACEWLNAHTPADTIVLTPRWQQTFKWYANRAEVATWKDIPQDPVSVVEWWRLIKEIYPPEASLGGLAGHGEQRLRELAEKHHATYILVDRRLANRSLRFKRVFPEDLTTTSAYEVYRP